MILKHALTLSDFEWQENYQRHAASRGLFATAELLTYSTLTVNNCQFTSASNFLQENYK